MQKSGGKHICSGCKRFLFRVSDKKSVVSYCEIAEKDIRMKWKPKSPKK